MKRIYFYFRFLIVNEKKKKKKKEKEIQINQTWCNKGVMNLTWLHIWRSEFFEKFWLLDTC